MRLVNLLHLCAKLFYPPASRAAARTVLVVPLHESVDKPQMRPVLAAAAAQLATSGKLWKWICTDGSVKLCSWDSSQKVFVRGTVEDWTLFFGRNWIVKDTDGREYLGPSFAVCDRLIQAVLKHPATPTATWAEQLRRKREGAK
jgi:hypothetical protein